MNGHSLRSRSAVFICRTPSLSLLSVSAGKRLAACNLLYTAAQHVFLNISVFPDAAAFNSEVTSKALRTPHPCVRISALS